MICGYFGAGRVAVLSPPVSPRVSRSGLRAVVPLQVPHRALEQGRETRRRSPYPAAVAGLVVAAVAVRTIAAAVRPALERHVTRVERTPAPRMAAGRLFAPRYEPSLVARPFPATIDLRFHAIRRSKMCANNQALSEGVPRELPLCRNLVKRQCHRSRTLSRAADASAAFCRFCRRRCRLCRVNAPRRPPAHGSLARRRGSSGRRGGAPPSAPPTRRRAGPAADR